MKFLCSILVVITAVITGCSSITTKTVHVTEPLKPVAIADVKFLDAAPTNAVHVADIFAEASNSTEGAESAQVEIKKQAAAIGANFVVMDNVDVSGQILGVCEKFRIEGHAYSSIASASK